MDTRPSLTLRRRLAAPPARVYAAWTDPTRIAGWWGPARAETLHAEIDARVGGRFHVAFRTEDGERHDVGGVYREVVPDVKLVFTWVWRTMPERPSLVTVLIEDDGQGTVLTLIHEAFFDEAARDRHREGWSGALEKLAAYVA
jgi:uncharacterized protein YndB with AHSA1/START domain